MKLEKRVRRDFKDVQKAANNLYAYSLNRIFKKIVQTNRDVLSSVAVMLTLHPGEINYQSLLNHRSIDRLRDTLNRQYDILADEIEADWTKTRNQFDLIGRLGVHFVAKKASPPWKKSVINLKDSLSTDGRYDPRTGRLRFYFSNIVDQILREIKAGALKKESANKILARLKPILIPKATRRMREAAFKDTTDDTDVIVSAQADDIAVTEGVFTQEDVALLKAELTDANNWAYRQIDPNAKMSDRINNANLRSFEQLLSADALDQLHSGMLQIGGENLGINDMQWVATHTSTTCDHCTDRDGLTTLQISDQIKDEYGDDPPPPVSYTHLTLPTNREV